MLLGEQAAQNETQQAATQNEEEYDQRYRQWTHDLLSSVAAAWQKIRNARERLPDRLCCRPSLQKPLQIQNWQESAISNLFP